MKKLEISQDVEIIDSAPCIYIKSIDAVVLSDLHLGFEGIKAEEGIYLPKVQYKKTIELLEKITSIKHASTIILNGDTKHEFSQTSYHEFNEISELFFYLKAKFRRIILVKGNHDNFIERITSKFNVELHKQLKLGNYLFLHGHELPVEDANTLVIGHEHPAIGMMSQIRVKEKLRCFLFGKTKSGRNIIVLPAACHFSQGSEINLIPKNELLSPILKKLVDVDNLEAIGIGEGMCFKFPKIGKLRE